MGNQETNEVQEEVIRVLVVDDHPVVRDGIVQLLNREPDLKVCAEASDYEQCMRALEETSPHIALVDISLPGKSGIGILEQIEKEYPDISALVLSMHDEPFYAERALKCGAKGYISKMEPTESVIEAIRCVMGGDTYLSPKIGARLAGKLMNKKKKGPSMDSLSARELEVFLLIGQGFSTRQICDDLKLSPKTVETHRAGIKKKLGLKGGAQLVKCAIEWRKASSGKGSI